MSGPSKITLRAAGTAAFDTTLSTVSELTGDLWKGFRLAGAENEKYQRPICVLILSASRQQQPCMHLSVELVVMGTLNSGSEGATLLHPASLSRILSDKGNKSV